MTEPEWENMTDWSGLPEVYLTVVQRKQGMFWRVEACSVPMAIGPEVPLIRRDPAVFITLPEVQAMIAAKLEEVLRLQPYDDDGFKAVHNDPEVFVRLDDIRALITPDMTTALKARDKRIRREAMERAVTVLVEEQSRLRAKADQLYEQDSVDCMALSLQISDNVKKLESYIAAIRAEIGGE